LYAVGGLVAVFKLFTFKFTFNQIKDPAKEFERMALKNRMQFSKSFLTRAKLYITKKAFYISYYLDFTLYILISAGLAYLFFVNFEDVIENELYTIFGIGIVFLISLGIFGFLIRNQSLVVRNFTSFSRNLDVLIPFFQNFYDEKEYFIRKMGVMNIYYANEAYRVLSIWLQGSTIDKIYDKRLQNPLYPVEAEELMRTLGLNPSKKYMFSDIKRTYRELVKKYHPDVTKSNPQSVLQFKEISRAYSILFSKYAYLFDD
jgi:hypothetical protein